MEQMLLQASLVLIVSVFLWQLFRNRLNKSPLASIPGPPSTSWLKGNLGQLFDHFGWDFQDELRDKYGSVVKLESKFGQKALYVFDPRALHHILVKEYQTVYDRPTWSTGGLTFGPGLLSTTGDWHRKQRKMLNPVFSINHMRHMTPIFYDVAHKVSVPLPSMDVRIGSNVPMFCLSVRKGYQSSVAEVRRQGH
ncbi:cytochrome P450 [Panus rudis PR-1116 ss-1]|nr:cytochrome P450 [Panus rudis PR-1116 ss-1]